MRRWPGVGRALALVLVLAFGTALIVACDDDDDGNGDGDGVTPETGEAGTEASEVTVTLDEWVVEPSMSSASAGEVTFTATNDGTIEHELVIIRSDLAPDALPVDDEGAVPEDEVEVVDEIEEFPPGETESLTVELDAGSYVLICNIDDHYSQGMRTGFTVE